MSHLRFCALRTLQLRWLKANGLEFQDLFADVMENAWPKDFQRVSPYGGPSGDLKCDGFLTSKKCVFQCYGPVSIRERDVIGKIKADLVGAIEHWRERMAQWVFVYNDPRGPTAKVLQCINDLREDFRGIEIEMWTWPQIREQFEKLSDDAVTDLFGYPPASAAVDQLSFNHLRPVVEQIAKGDPSPGDEFGKPPSVTKLQKNSLDAESAEFLRLGRRRVGLVEDYFEQHHDPTLGDSIAKTMQAQYQMLSDGGLDASEVLLELQKFAGWGAGGNVSHDFAVLAVITYFFDRCDIYEDPDEETDGPVEA